MRHHEEAGKGKYMRIKLVNEGSLIVDCHNAMKNGKRWTLVDNKTEERTDFQASGEIVSHLRCEADVKAYIDELAGVRAQEAEENAKCKMWAFFVDKGAAPALLNLLDASSHVVEWEVRRMDNILNSDVVRIDYKSDRQLLFQKGGNAVFRYPADDGKEAGTAREQVQGL